MFRFPFLSQIHQAIWVLGRFTMICRVASLISVSFCSPFQVGASSHSVCEDYMEKTIVLLDFSNTTFPLLCL